MEEDNSAEKISKLHAEINKLQSKTDSLLYMIETERLDASKAITKYEDFLLTFGDYFQLLPEDKSFVLKKEIAKLYNLVKDYENNVITDKIKHYNLLFDNYVERNSELSVQNKKLKKENNSLKTEIQKVYSDLIDSESLLDTLSEIKSENSALKLKNMTLESTVSTLKSHNELMEEKLKKLEKEKFDEENAWIYVCVSYSETETEGKFKKESIPMKISSVLSYVRSLDDQKLEQFIEKNMFLYNDLMLFRKEKEYDSLKKKIISLWKNMGEPQIALQKITLSTVSDIENSTLQERFDSYQRKKRKLNDSVI